MNEATEQQREPVRETMSDLAILFPRVIASCITLACFFCEPLPAPGAELLFDAGVRQTYEDNLNSAPDGQPRQGDHSTTFFAEIGGYVALVEAATYLGVRTTFEGYDFSTYNELDGITAGMQIDIYSRWSLNFASQVLVRASRKDYADDQRDSTAGGAGLSLAQQATDRLWFRESVEYERSDARTDLYSYDGTKAAVLAGLRAAPPLFLGAGFTLGRRSYDDTAGYRSDCRSVSLLAEYRMADNVMIGLLYELQRYETRNPSSRYDNTITSGRVTYSY